MDEFQQHGDPVHSEEPTEIFDDVDWDEDKNAANRAEHGVSFEEASTCFYDEENVFFQSPTRKGGERRFVMYGTS